MKIRGEQVLKSERAEIWNALQDPEVLSNTIPGLQRLEILGPDRYAVTVKVGVGSVKGTYDGTFALSEKEDQKACRIQAKAGGGPGSVEAIAQMRLADQDGGGTMLSYEADAAVTGPVAGVGQRMIGAAANKTTREFLTALDEQVRNGHSTAQTPGTRAEPETDGQASEDAGSGPESDGVRPAARNARATEQGTVFEPRGPQPASGSWRLHVPSLVAGFVLALVGVGFGYALRGQR
jgi:carbon monoxide dehydrogenase subunit G